MLVSSLRFSCFCISVCLWLLCCSAGCGIGGTGSDQRRLVVHLNLIVCLSFPHIEHLTERSVSASSPPLTFPSPFCFVFFLPPPPILHSAPSSSAGLDFGPLSSLLVSLHNLLGRTPQSIFSSVEDAVLIFFMQISRSDTHSISSKNLSLHFYSHIHVGCFPAAHLAFK